MNLFDSLVDNALSRQPQLGSLRVVVEKELLHHDILRAMSEAGLLQQLTFIGGTCLRACYGSHRLSEDLDFSGGADFTREQLVGMADHLRETLHDKYDLNVEVSEPTRDSGNVATWKLKIQTRPGRPDLPAQKINIDVCAIPSYLPQPRMLLNPYGVDMGTMGLIVNAESREEIFADKLIAFALRPNRLKHRDLWDIVWLHQAGVKPALDLRTKKLADHQCTAQAFNSAFSERVLLLKNDPKLEAAFLKEMQRFLPASQLRTVEQVGFWSFLSLLFQDLQQQVKSATAN